MNNYLDISITMKIFTDEFIESLSTEHKRQISQISPSEVLVKLLSDQKISEVTSSLKGQRAEESIQEWIVSKFPTTAGFEMVHTAKTSRSGDIHLTFTDPNTGRIITMIIEIKDYKNKIPTKEVNKFKRDIEVQTPDIAVMISLGSLITKFPKNELMMFDTSGRTTCCYIHNINTFDPDRDILYQVLSFLFKNISMTGDANATTDSKNNQILCQQLKDRMIPFNHITQDLYKMQDDLSKKIRAIVAKMVESVTHINDILESSF